MINKPSDYQSEQTNTPPAPQPAPVVPPVAVTPQNNPQTSNGLAIAAMVIGIVAFLLGWVPFLGFALGVTAIVLGIVGLKKSTGKGMSIAGLVTGGLAVLLNLVFVAIFLTSLALFGGVASQAGQALNEYSAEQQVKLDAKKDFNKGETAVFDTFEVKANLAKRDYVPDSQFSQASEGKELIVVDVSAKNIGNDAASISSFDLKLNAKGVANSSQFITVDPEFTGGSLSKGATATGNIVFEIEKGATDLKLQYETTVYDTSAAKSKVLAYTLKI
ncbi:DUF4190 and DUF4352 domain-containing protein [Candidatus Saccharibacteria bacterium]|nr:DUF4190 and DUF4352 domain-containing protein [Candidatus Saccharibacteria bacterium]